MSISFNINILQRSAHLKLHELDRFSLRFSQWEVDFLLLDIPHHYLLTVRNSENKPHCSKQFILTGEIWCMDSSQTLTRPGCTSSRTGAKRQGPVASGKPGVLGLRPDAQNVEGHLMHTRDPRCEPPTSYDWKICWKSVLRVGARRCENREVIWSWVRSAKLVEGKNCNNGQQKSGVSLTPTKYVKGPQHPANILHCTSTSWLFVSLKLHPTSKSHTKGWRGITHCWKKSWTFCIEKSAQRTVGYARFLNPAGTGWNSAAKAHYIFGIDSDVCSHFFVIPEFQCLFFLESELTRIAGDRPKMTITLFPANEHEEPQFQSYVALLQEEA